MSKVAIYIRVSSVYQLDGDSLPIQRTDLKSYATMILECNDYVIFEDAGFSAGTTKRPKYQEMMLRIRQGEFTHLLVWKIDRISRNILDFCDLYQELKDLNVSFVSKMEQFDTSNAVGQALLKIILVFAELERHNASERSKAVLLAKAAAGEYTGFRIPFGYRRCKETNEYSIDEKEADIVRKIFDMYEAGHTSHAISVYLNELTLEKRIKKVWVSATIDRMLTNVFYTGVLRYNLRSYDSNKKWVINAPEDLVLLENDHPSIIGPIQFQKCLELYLHRKEHHFQHRTPLFADLLFCFEDNETLQWKKENPRIIESPSTYCCPRCACKNHRCINDAEIGSFILNYLSNLLRTYRRWTPEIPELTLKKSLFRGKNFQTIKALDKTDWSDFFNMIRNSRSVNPTFSEETVKSLKFDIQLEQRGIEKLNRLYNYVDSDMSEEEYLEYLDKMEGRIQSLTAKLKSMTKQNTNQIPEDIDFLYECHIFFMQYKLYHLNEIDFAELYDKVPFYELKHFLNRVIHRIYFENGRISAISFMNEHNHAHHFMYQ